VMMMRMMWMMMIDYYNDTVIQKCVGNKTEINSSDDGDDDGDDIIHSFIPPSIVPTV